MYAWRGVAFIHFFIVARVCRWLASSITSAGIKRAMLGIGGLIVVAFAPSQAAALAAATTTTISASTTSTSFGSNITFTATVTSASGTPDGTLIFLADLVSLGAVTLNGSGQATFATATLPVGVHSIVAVYVGNLNFLTSTSIGLNVNISLAACTISVAASINPLIFGTSVNLTATVIGSGATPTGTVTLNAGATVIGNVTLGGGGQGVLSINTLAVGLLSIGASYSGDANFLPCTAPVIILTVNKSSTTSAVTSSANPDAVGTPVTFTATISGSGGTPTGNVTFKDGATVLGTGTLDGGGQASLATASLAAGSHAISVTYIGDSNFVGSTSPTLTQVVNQSASSTTLASSANPAAAGSPVTFTATVTGAGLTPTGTVTFKDGATTIGSGTLNGSGQTTLTTSALGLGSHSVTAIYGGDSNFTGSSSSALAQVAVSNGSATSLGATPNPAAVGSPVTLTAAVTGSGGTPTGSVSFRDGGTALGTVALDGSGHASLVISGLASGSHAITAIYSGDATFASSTSSTVTLQITGGGATTSNTALAATPNPARSGAPVTFTATITGAGGTPTGTVTFKDGATSIGTSALDGSGHATLITSSLTTGSHAITAVYGGDGTYATSTSATLALSITPGGTATTTNLSSSANPSVLGRPVTFTATIAASGGTATGSVTFKDGGMILGAVALTGSSASLTLSSLGFGTHSITATYGGNASFAASTSAALAQSISAPPDSIKLRNLQVMVTRVVSQNAGQAISGAIDAAIDEGFSDGNQMLAPSELGLRLSSAGYDRQVNGSPKGAPAISPDWLVWSDVRHSAWNTNSSASDLNGNQVNALAGITHKMTPDFLLGVFGGYETFNYDVASLNGHLKGGGWTAGGYVGWRIIPGIRFDAGVAQSDIDYQGSAGTAAGSFQGSRTLVTTALTGVYKLTPAFELEPSARIYALWEKENAYTDSLGVVQADRSFSTGRASVGTKLIYRWAWSDTIALAPYAGIYADNYFTRDDATTGTLYTPGLQGASARVIGGVALTTDSGLKLSSAAEFGGIGGGFTSWSLRARGAVAF